jgi:small subunit ribosomal protein S1
MATKESNGWNNSKIVDEHRYDMSEVEDFKNLMSTVEGSADRSVDLIPGKILKGIVVEITKDFIVIDVGLKSEGLVPIEEFSHPEDLVLGGEAEVYLDIAEDSNGQIVLSREKAERQRQWEHIVETCEEGSIVKGKCTRKVKGGLIVDIGIEAFLPGSQIDNKRIKSLDDYIDNTYEFKILKINVDRKNVVVSRRALIEAERDYKKAEILEHIEEGAIVEGVVKNITDFGVFLDLDGVDGLLHIRDMTWKRIKHPSEMVNIGDTLEVVILGIDKDKGRIALGLKQKEQNPWDNIKETYPIGTRVKGKIVNLVPYGAFMEIEDGFEGLIHISEMSWTKNVTDPQEVVSKGDIVEAIVLSIQQEEGKISLGLKQIAENPWDKVVEKYSEGTVLNVEVKNLTNYGAFVELEPGVEGLILISDLSWTKKVSHPSESLKKGDKIKAVILSVDVPSKKITLGLKQLTKNPWEEIEDSLPTDTVVRGTVSKVTAFGAFVKIEEISRPPEFSRFEKIGSGDEGELEGLVHVSELSDQPFGKVEDVVNEGDKVTAVVIKVDPKQMKIALSIRMYQIAKNRVNRDDIVVSNSDTQKG